jgi:Putative DNA-binding domain
MPVNLQMSWQNGAVLFAASLLDAERDAPNFLTSANGVNDARRFAVYKNNVTVSLVRALQSNFPAIVKLVGEEYFSALARVFVTNHPPKSRIMAQYGAEFPAFLAGFEPLAAYPYLADVAQLEQIWREAYHEADAKPVTLDQLATVPATDVAALRFTAHPAARFLQSRYAAGSIFSANRSDNEHRHIDAAKSEYALITRPHFDCALRILNGAEGAFVSGLLNGETLQGSATKAMATGEDFDLSASIAGILQAGAFSDFSIDRL